jgi:hypothetical protein
MKLDKDTKDVMRSLIEDKIFLPHNRCVDVTKVLDEDNKLDLWLLEAAIRNSIRFVRHALGVHSVLGIAGLNSYYEIRGLMDNYNKRKEETDFIVHFFVAIEEDEPCTTETLPIV